MFVLKAFAANAQYTNNALGVVNAIGEISTQSLTYARDKGQYRGAVSSDITLITFTAAQDNTAVVLTQAMSDHVIGVVKGVYDYITAHPGLIAADQLLAYLLTTFSADAENFISGNIVPDANGNYAPEWLQWSNKTITGLGGNALRVWFADASFQSQYDDFQIVIVPPLVNLNDFFKTPTDVQAALNAQTPVALMGAVAAAKQGYPETVLAAETFNYVDPFDPTHLIPTTWYAIVYGAAGNNPDSISDALVSYILANSTHTKPEWTPILPDIFRRTEFMLIPMWDQYAIANMVIQAGIYSPIANLKRAVALLKTVINDPVNYPEAHIDDHATVMAHPYKSLQILSIGSPSNRDSLYELGNVFPDILAVASTSLDFGRMQPGTQTFLDALADMLPSAETLTQFTSIPTGMTRVTRNGHVFLVKRVGNIDYLILAKGELTTVIPGV